MASIKSKAEQVKDELKQSAYDDFYFFVCLVAPHRVFGDIHREVMRWVTRREKKTHQLVLLPRDHQKSAIAGYYAAWRILKNPAIRILYLSSTANLANKQLKFIKDILTCPVFTRYWPEYVNEQEGKREKWSETEISIDHPMRKREGVRDSTVFAAGLTTNTTGLHCDLSILDDIVVYDNAYTEEGRSKTEQQYSLLSSIEGTDAEELVVGTRYFPTDIYNRMQEMSYQVFDEHGDIIKEEYLYETFAREVEDRGDGTGQYLWPRQQRPDGRWFGFNQEILSRKRGQYLDTVQFRAQYYNNPNDPSGADIDRGCFQYYDPKYLECSDGNWYYKQHRLNVFASIDFAFSLSKRADHSCVIVVGVNKERQYFVLDIDRFKTDQIPEYFKHILQMYQKWDFRKLRAEVTAGQTPIVEALKKDYIRVHGLALSIDEFRPNRHGGTKEERIKAILQPKYRNGQVFHYQGGYCQVLEEELMLSKPAHDDVKDALASCIDICIPPSMAKRALEGSKDFLRKFTHSQFGGLA